MEHVFKTELAGCGLYLNCKVERNEGRLHWRSDHLPGWKDMKGAAWEEEITSFAYEKLGVPSRKFRGPEAVGYPHRSYGEANWVSSMCTCI